MNTSQVLMNQKAFEDRFDKIAKLLRNEDAKEFLKWIQEMIAQQQTQLEGTHELVEMGRCQGRLEILKKILKAREE